LWARKQAKGVIIEWPRKEEEKAERKITKKKHACHGEKKRKEIGRDDTGRGWDPSGLERRLCLNGKRRVETEQSNRVLKKASKSSP